MQVTMTQERGTPLSPGVAVLSPIEIQSVPARIDAVDTNKWLHRLPPTRLVQESAVTIPPGTVVSREPQENIPQGTAGVEQERIREGIYLAINTTIFTDLNISTESCNACYSKLFYKNS